MVCRDRQGGWAGSTYLMMNLFKDIYRSSLGIFMGLVIFVRNTDDDLIRLDLDLRKEYNEIL